MALTPPTALLSVADVAVPRSGRSECDAWQALLVCTQACHSTVASWSEPLTSDSPSLLLCAADILLPVPPFPFLPSLLRSRSYSRGMMSASHARAGSSVVASAPAATAVCDHLSASASPPHLILHRHALESIFGSLSFDELRTALLVSRRWQAAVYTMRGLEKGGAVRLQGFYPIPSSPLARHISALAGSVETALSPEHLQQACRSMPFLRMLYFCPLAGADWSAAAAAAMRFPPTLTHVHLLGHPCSAADINAVIVMLSSHSPLRILRLWMPTASASASAETALVSFAPLRSLPNLQLLHLSGGREAFSATQVQEVRVLTQLNEFFFHQLSEEQLIQILQPPSNSKLQWKELPGRMLLTDSVVALLPPMPRLSKIACYSFPHSLRSLAFFAQMATLTEVELYAGMREEWQRMDSMLLALHTPMPHIASFSLEQSYLSTAELSTLLALMPTLSSLKLHRMSNVSSLPFLAPLQDTLRNLRLSACAHAALTPSVLLEALNGLQLTDLGLDRSLSGPLEESEKASLTPPSSILPSLQRFFYYPSTRREPGVHA